MFNISEQEIRAIANSRRVYESGSAYAQNNRVANFRFRPEKGLITAEVEGNWTYDVNIFLEPNGALHSYFCTCPAYGGSSGACKHIIAVLKAARQKLIPAQDMADPKAASEFMAVFASPEQDTPWEELTLELELQIQTSFRQPTGYLQLKTGLSRLYMVKNLEEFLSAVKLGNLLEFGQKFTYDPARHTFNQEDSRVIAMLQDMVEQYLAFNEIRSSAYSSSPFTEKPFVLSTYYLGKFLDALGDKAISFNAGSAKTLGNSSPRPTRVIQREIPLDFAVKAKGQDLALSVEGSLPLLLSGDGRYYLYNQAIYQVPAEQQALLPNLLKALSQQSRPVIIFPAEQKDRFASEALPLIERVGSVAIEAELAQKFIKENLHTKIYFDRSGGDGISARLEFHYGELLINPFMAGEQTLNPSLVKDYVLIRDMEQEQKILRVFEHADFTVSQGKISLESDEKIFEFIVNYLPRLQEWAEIFYSDDFKLKIRTSTSFSGRVRLDESLDLLEISFQYGDIDSAELANIFQSLQMKKKYYRLRDGSFLDLQQPELQSMAMLLDHLGLDEDDFNDSTLHIPKFRAMYIDSFLRQANLPGIQRNRAFKQLVQNILEPQDSEFDPPAELSHVLRDYQKTGFKWLKTLSSYHLGGILADDMGLGKTLQVLAFILAEQASPQAAPTLEHSSSLPDQPASLPALVIAPTSLVYNWQTEGAKFTPTLKIMVVDGTPQERQAQLAMADSYDLVVVSYAVLRRDIEAFSQLDFSYCFLDEAQNIKNHQTLNAKSVQQIRAKGYFALTGTPIENSLSELWSLFNFFMPGYLLSHHEFHKKYASPIYKGDAQALEELSRHTKPFILRRLKKDVLKELPPKIETQIKAPLTEEQRKLYLAYLQETKGQIARELAVSGFAKSQIKILAALTRLRQICCHPTLFVENYGGESGKFLLFQEILADALSGGHRILVFSQFTSMLEIIRQDLNAKEISYFYLDGSTPAIERTQMAHAFNGGQGQVFLISLKAGGTGLNLTGADMVIHFDPWWNPAVEDQATDRTHRIGQNSSVQVIKLLTQGTIEEKVSILQERKKKLIDSVIQPGETMLSKLTEAELKELFEIE